MGVHSEISRREHSYTETEQKIASYILNKGEVAMELSSEELAKLIGVSQSAVIKFVKKSGFKGFTEFKVELSKEYAETKQQNTFLTHGDISLVDSLADVSRAIVAESVTALTETYSHLDINTINQSIKMIDSAKRIYLCGTGSSMLPAWDLTNKLVKIGLTAIWYQDREAMEVAAMSAGADDIFIVFSFSGETERVIRIIEMAKKQDAKVVLVTKNSASTLAKLADIYIEIISNETVFRTAAMSSRIAFFSIVDILFLGVIKQDLKNRLAKVRDSYELLKRK